jgi:NADH:ubiquinone reductase (non-electrogenic)
MASMLRKFARRTAKVGVLCGGLYGAVVLTDLQISDDLDDPMYLAKRKIRNMMGKTSPEKKKVVILGSGWGALSMAKKLDSQLYTVTVCSPRPFFFYTPLLCGSTTGTVAPGSIIEPIRDAAPDCNFLNVACKDVDLDAKQVHCTTGAGSTNVVLDYDHLVVAVGAQPNTFGIPGVDKYAKFLKEMEHGRELRRHLLNRLEEADVAFAVGDIDKAKRLLSIVVVGGGPTGVEFCGELSDLIKRDLTHRFPNLNGYFKVTLVEALPGLLTMFQKAVGEHVKEHLISQGVDVRLNAAVKEAKEDNVQIKRKDGTVDTLDYGTLVWVAGVGMRPFTKALCTKIGAEAGQTDRRGLVVDGCLRVKGTRQGEVFAIGDCAISGNPPTAQVAGQQGKYLGRIFRYGNESLIADDTAPPFKYNHQGTMAYTGDSAAATELNPEGIMKLGKGTISDHLWWRSLYGEVDHIRVMGFVGFAVWRSVYFSKMFSSRGRWCVASDWLRTTFYGRPASSSAQGTHSSVNLA